MILPSKLPIKVLNRKQVDGFSAKGHLGLCEYNKLDPYPTSEEMYSLGNSLIATGFSNEMHPIVLYRGYIADGKSTLQALKNIKSNKFYFAIIPKETEQSEVNDFILRTQMRRDKTKTQKAIGAFRYYQLNPTMRYTDVAKMFGVSERTVKACKVLHLAGHDDVLETLHSGGRYTYEATNNRTGVIEKKHTTSINVVANIMKGKQKDIDNTGKSFDEVDTHSEDTNPIVMAVLDMVADMDKGMVKKIGRLLLEMG